MAPISEERSGSVWVDGAAKDGNGSALSILEILLLLAGTYIDWPSRVTNSCRLPNDRLLLGMKGTLSEMELSTFRQRSQEALRQKAARGELLTTVAIGYLRTADDWVEMDPDKRVCEAISLVFVKFRELGSMRQVLLWLRQESIELPSVTYGAEGRAVVWKLPVYATILKFLTNPIYGR